jgi:hypothetical protein
LKFSAPIPFAWGCLGQLPPFRRVAASQLPKVATYAAQLITSLRAPRGEWPRSRTGRRVSRAENRQRRTYSSEHPAEATTRIRYDPTHELVGR